MLKKIKIFFIILIILFVAGAIFFVNSLFVPASQESKLVYFKIESGQGAEQIADNLKKEKLIRNKLVFKIYVWLTGEGSHLLAGEHKLSTDMNVMEVLKNLTDSGNVNKEKKITIIEGWRAKEIGEYLEKQRLVKKEEFLSAIKAAEWRDKYDFLTDVKVDNLEGFLFPDTYRVFNDAKVEEIVKKMLDNFGRKLTNEMRDEIKKQNKDIFEVITLASIIEREAKDDEDKRLVADIFLKRLDLGIGLQSDATVNFITGKKDLRPSATDTQIDSPYNTYKYRGLPPGPIANPGLVAIKAVIYPKKNDYYFFLMDKEGKTHYAKTYSEHQENIRKYLE